MKIHVVGKAHLQGTSKKTGNPYDFIQVHYLGRAPGVIGDAALSVIGKARGKKQSVLVLTERQTRFEIIFRASAKTSAATVSALKKLLKKFPQGTFQSLTVDNGSEFQDSDSLQALVPALYYCHPYTSCERGSNENANRIIRRYLPKGRSMKKVTQRDCDTISRNMNNMHRKILNYRTAAELFEEQLALLRQSAPAGG